jgi:hypothetical protein
MTMRIATQLACSSWILSFYHKLNPWSANFHKCSYTQLCENSWFWEFMNKPENSLSVHVVPNVRFHYVHSLLNCKPQCKRNEDRDTNKCGPCETCLLTTNPEKDSFIIIIEIRTDYWQNNLFVLSVAKLPPQLNSV